MIGPIFPPFVNEVVFPSEFGSHIDKGILVVFQDIPAVPPGPGGAARLDPRGFGAFRKRFLSGSGAREGMTSFRTSPFRSSFTRMTRQGISEDEGAEKPPGS